MKKFSVLVSTLLFISMVSFSQTTKENIERLARDPKTTENAAKADVYIVANKKIIGDDSSKKRSNRPSSLKTVRKKTKRGK